MHDHETSQTSTTEGLPVAPSLGPALDAAEAPAHATVVGRREVFISVVAVGIAVVAGFVAQILTRLIGLITNLSFYGRVDTAFASPAGNHLGALVVLVPVAGAIIVGLMARYGSKAIRGHGIPEAMEQVLFNHSRIPPRITFLKPVSAAISIGTGGPFGAEGPIIATGGAFGSLVGQLLRTTADERKTLLAAGAAAGMAATFGSPVSAVLLAIELLLFEYRPRSLVPVSLATAAATCVRMAFQGAGPVFPMDEIAQPGGAAMAYYIVLGAVVGVLSVWVTRAVYAIEDAFEKLPVHWMWWPALGALVVGVVGYVAPHTMGVGYDNIEHIVAGSLTGRALAFLVAMKFLSWSVSLGSGTSGGTLAPLFTIGGGAGSLLTAGAIALAPGLGADVRIGALVGMAALFAGSSRAVLASIVFAFETTRQPAGLLPLLGGCAAAFLVSSLMMRNSIMTEKIVRRGAHVPSEYEADAWSQLRAGACAARPVVTLAATDALGSVRAWIATGAAGSAHQGFPVLNDAGQLLGVLTRRDLLDASRDDGANVGTLVKRAPVVVYEDSTLREAADRMAAHGVGRVPVVRRDAPRVPVGILTRGDLLAAHGRRLEQQGRAEKSLALRALIPGLREATQE